MEHHVLTKTIALLLCALFLLGAVGSTAGILVMTELDLYRRSFRDAYDENVESWADGLAYNIGVRYASGALGGCDTQLLDNQLGTNGYYDVFDMSRVGYAVKDAHGEVLQRQPLDPGTTPGYTFSFPAGGRYLNLVEALTQEEWERQQIATNENPFQYTGEGNVLYDAVPSEGAYVTQITVTWEDDSSEGISSQNPIGFLSYDQEGWLNFQFFHPDGFLPEEELGRTVTGISFGDENHCVLFEARDPGGVGKFYRDSQGDLWFTANLAELYAPQIPEETGEMGARAVVNRKTPIWTLMEGKFERQKYYYGKDYEVTIYATKVVDGILYGCTTKGYMTGTAYRSEWVALEDVTFISVPAGSGNGIRATCLRQTRIWALDGGACYDTGMHYQQGQQIGILVLGTFDSGEWGLTDLGWVQLSDVSLAGSTQAEESDSTKAAEASDPTKSTEITEIIEESVAPETTIPEITFSIEPLDPSEESVNLEEPREIPVPAAQTNDPAGPTTIPQTIPETATAIAYPDAEYAHYYDYDTDQAMVALFTYESIPEGYTVEIQLAEGAMRHQQEWVLLELMYQFRSQLPKVLGVSALLFILLAVYLCCAAGRSPGTAEIRAGGLNRLPLDLYAGITIGGIAVATVLGVEGFREFSDKNLNVALGLSASMAYLASLLLVGFGFGVVAQSKTPEGFWWRNSICGRSGILIYRCGEKAAEFYVRKGRRVLVGLLQNLWKLIRFFWGMTLAGCKRICRWLIRSARWMSEKFVRFLAMLPLTWQWLLAGGTMIFFLFITVAGRYDLGIILSILFAVGLVMYGAHAFGVLLEGVNRMNEGDLDIKVDDRLLVGSFKEFSHELNGLADVVVLAAQKQLRSERMKTELITNVSHDIKTPLTSIINYVDLLQKPHTDAEQTQYLEVLDRQSQRLKKLVDDLMDMSKANTGNMAVEIGIVDGAEAINQALGEFADKLEKAELIPVFRQPENRVQMLADGRLVWRVMSNLLSNAVKYALPGTRLYVDLSEVDGNVVISMKNISREELNVQAEELLERFVRGDISRNTEGSGLGLNIARSLMELQRGQLQLLVDGDLFKVTLIFPGV